MFKDLLTELVFLGVLILVTFISIASWKQPWYYGAAVPPFLILSGLVIYGIYHFYSLSNDGKTKHARAFIISLIAIMIFFSVIFLIFGQPERL